MRHIFAFLIICFISCSAKPNENEQDQPENRAKIEEIGSKGACTLYRVRIPSGVGSETYIYWSVCVGTMSNSSVTK